MLDHIGLDIDPATRVARLTLQQKRLVEIARALAGEARLLILDEPTASMTAPEVDGLFQTLDRLRQTGTSIIYISHQISEVFQLCDRVLVLKDGGLVEDRRVSDADPRQVLSVMLGRPVSNLYPAVATTTRTLDHRPALEVVDLALTGQSSRLSFDLRHGEILGVFGLLGSGQEALGPAVFGTAGFRTGTARVEGVPLAPSIRGRIAQGIGYLPAERKRDGIVPEMSVLENIGLRRANSASSARMPITKGQRLEMKATSSPGTALKSAGPISRPWASGRRKSGAGVPRATGLDSVFGMALSISAKG